MDCPLCNLSWSPIILRPLRYTICGACYEGARSVISFTNKLQNYHKGGGGGGGGSGDNKSVNSSFVSPQNPSKGFANALRWIKETKEMEEELNDKLVYLGSFVAAFKEKIHTDIQVLPGDNGLPIPTHRALLAIRSNILKNVLGSDGYMAPPNDTIAFPEFTYEELECLLEFLYSGHLTKEKVEKHVYSLSIAADKYEIPFLANFCENQMRKSLNSNNALEVLEISDTCSNQSLKEAVLKFIVKNMGDIVFSAKFDAFALKNPHLSVEITRASFIDGHNI
ncbi:hypothetical protein LguiA_034787 [Lonicera macranthoides]